MTQDSPDRKNLIPKGETEMPDEVTDALRERGSPGFATYDFEILSRGAQCILIRIAGEIYTLRKTQSGKLILNK